jgi:predicted ArsR family transcriptional regulator
VVGDLGDRRRLFLLPWLEDYFPMTIDLVLKFLKDPGREYDASEVAEELRLHEDAVRSHLRSLWKGGILERRKDSARGRLVYRTKQAQLPMENTAAGAYVAAFRERAGKVFQEVLDEIHEKQP